MEKISNSKYRIFVNIPLKEYLSIDDARLFLVSWLLMKKKKGHLIANLNDLNTNGNDGKLEKILFAHLRWLGCNIDIENGFSENILICRQSKTMEMYFNLVQKLASQRLVDVIQKQDQKKEEILKKIGTNLFAEAFNTNIFFVQLKEAFKIEPNAPFEIRLKISPEKEHEILRRIRTVFHGSFKLNNFITIWDGVEGPNADLMETLEAHNSKASHVLRKRSDTEASMNEIIFRTLMDWPIPEFVHIPTINKEPKLTPFLTSLEALRREGYLSATLRDVFCGFGTKAFESTISGEGKNSFQMFELKQLDQDKFLFHENTLDEINHHYIMHLDIDTVFRLSIPYLLRHQIPLENKAKIRRIIGVLRNYLPRLELIATECQKFFADSISIEGTLARSVLRKDCAQRVLWAFQRRAKIVEQMMHDGFLEIMRDIQYETGIIGRDLWLPIRLALTGTDNQYELAVVAEILGKEKCVKRIHAIVGDYW